jgi:alkaline phosphatase D
MVLYYPLHLCFRAISTAASNEFVLTDVNNKVGKSKSNAYFTNAFNGENVELIMHGNFFDTNADIVCAKTGLPVARIERELFNARQFFGSKQTYFVTVAPNVDMAVIAALCICLDERRNEN